MIVNPRKEMDPYLEDLYTELDSVLEVLEAGNSRLRTCNELDQEAKKLVGRFERLQSAFYVYWYAIHYDIAITEDYLQEDDRFKIWQVGFREFTDMNSEGFKLWSDANLEDDKCLTRDTHPNGFGIPVPNETYYLCKYDIGTHLHNTLEWLALLDDNRAFAAASCCDNEFKEQYFYREIDDYQDIRHCAKEAEQRNLLPEFKKEVAEYRKRFEDEIFLYDNAETFIARLNQDSEFTNKMAIVNKEDLDRLQKLEQNSSENTGLNELSKATTIVDAIQQQTAAIDRQTEVLKEIASKPTSITANSVSISNPSLQKQDLNFQNTVGQVVAHADKIETIKEDK